MRPATGRLIPAQGRLTQPPPATNIASTSAATAQTDRSLKLPIYAEQGVGHCWLVDPLLRTLEAYALSDGRWLLLATLKEAEPVRLPPFDAIEFALDALWA